MQISIFSFRESKGLKNVDLTNHLIQIGSNLFSHGGAFAFTICSILVTCRSRQHQPQSGRDPQL